MKQPALLQLVIHNDRIVAKVSAVARLRIGIDGEGVTTLVVFMLCPLRCRYCLNPQTLSLESPYKEYTPQELYDELKVDSLYFLATGGGVTFGGGEPLLNAGFIKEFRTLCGEWKINVETSLNVPLETLEELADIVDGFIIDIKDMNPEIYLSYTGKDNSRVARNLKYMSDRGLGGKCVLRVPLIAGFNDEKDVESSVSELKSLGFENFDKFAYQTVIHGKR